MSDKLKENTAMWNIRVKVVIVMLFWVVTVPVCSAGTDDILSGRELLGAVRDSSPTRGEKLTTVTELLDKYAETQDKQKSYISKIEIAMDIVESYRFREFKRFSGKKKRYEFEEARFDGEERVNYRRTMWGNLSPESGFTPKTEASYTSYLWDGIDNLVSYNRVHDQPGRASFTDPKKMHLEYGKTMTRGCNNFLTGFVSTGVYERIDSVLRQAGTVSMQDKTEQVNGVDCYVIDSDTKYGRYSVWIDPEHGYNIAKLKHIREGDDLWVKGETMGKNHKILVAFEILRFEKIDGVWVPMEAKTKYRRDFPPVRGIGGNWSKNNSHVKRIEMVLNPDHDALGSFVLDDIRDGAMVHMYSTPGIKYTWQDGKLVDERGRKVDLKKLKK